MIPVRTNTIIHKQQNVRVFGYTNPVEAWVYLTPTWTIDYDDNLTLNSVDIDVLVWTESAKKVRGKTFQVLDRKTNVELERGLIRAKSLADIPTEKLQALASEVLSQPVLSNVSPTGNNYTVPSSLFRQELAAQEVLRNEHLKPNYPL